MANRVAPGSASNGRMLLTVDAALVIVIVAIAAGFVFLTTRVTAVELPPTGPRRIGRRSPWSKIPEGFSAVKPSFFRGRVVVKPGRRLRFCPGSVVLIPKGEMVIQFLVDDAGGGGSSLALRAEVGFWFEDPTTVAGLAFTKKVTPQMLVTRLITAGLRETASANSFGDLTKWAGDVLLALDAGFRYQGNQLRLNVLRLNLSTV